MRIYYHKAPHSNIGDDLNDWIWHKLIPQIDQNSSAEWLCGIGTIIDNRLDKLDGNIIVAGSGVRPSKPTEPQYKINRQTRISWLRGPLSAQTLGIDPKLAIVDPALLVRRYYKRSSKPQQKIGFIPHVYTAKHYRLDGICRKTNLTLIDPRLGREEFMHKLSDVSCVIAEAMHGAIIADAIGIPWTRVKLISWKLETEVVSDFKWLDWTSSLDIKPRNVPKNSFILEKRGRKLRLLNPLIESLVRPRLAKTLELAMPPHQILNLSSEKIRDMKTSQILDRIHRDFQL